MAGGGQCNVINVHYREKKTGLGGNPNILILFRDPVVITNKKLVTKIGNK